MCLPNHHLLLTLAGKANSPRGTFGCALNICHQRADSICLLVAETDVFAIFRFAV